VRPDSRVGHGRQPPPSRRSARWAARGGVGHIATARHPRCRNGWARLPSFPVGADWPPWSSAAEDVTNSLYINWLSVPFLFVPSMAIALYAAHVSGGFMRPWISLKPVWWFPLLFLAPSLGYLLLAVNMFVHRRTPGAITGRTAAGQASARQRSQTRIDRRRQAADRCERTRQPPATTESSANAFGEAGELQRCDPFDGFVLSCAHGYPSSAHCFRRSRNHRVRQGREGQGLGHRGAMRDRFARSHPREELRAP
jgi:hypothetical protein